MTTSFKRGAPRGVAVVRVGALGDTIVLFPLLAALRARFPSSRIAAIGRRDVFDLAVGAGWCDRAHSSESIGWWTVGAEGISADERVRDALRDVDLVIDFDAPNASVARAGELGVAEWRAFPALPPAGFPAPAARYYLDCAGESGVGVAGAPVHVVLPSRRTADAARRGALALAPGAGSPSKRAPIAWFVERARAARREGLGVAVIVGEADADAASDVRAAALPATEWWENLPIEELARRLATCSSFVANDSGVAHLAALVGLPGVVRFVASDPVVWKPPSPHVVAT